MSSLAFLVSELQSLASETRRKHPDVREAAEKSLVLLRASPERAAVNLSRDGPESEELLRPLFMGFNTRNAKVVMISIGSLQRLIALKAIPYSVIPRIISSLGDLMSQGVDVQLRILQTLLSLLTNFKEVHDELLGNALLLCFRLQESRIAVVSSTAAATLRQLVMFVFDKVADIDRLTKDDADEKIAESTFIDVTLPSGKVVKLHPSARDAFSVFEDLCLLANSEKPLFLKLESLPKTFALELIESVLTNYHALFRTHDELLVLLQHHLCPLLLKSLSERPLFPLTLRSTRVVFLLLKQFSAELTTEAEVFLMMLIKVVSGDPDAATEVRPQWMRVLAMEIIRGLCSDAELMRNVWERYDSNSASSNVFGDLVTTLKRLATEKPALLGVSVQMQGIGIQSHDSSSTSGYGLDVGSVAGIITSAASATMSGMATMMSSEAGLSVAGSAMKLQCIDQLDKSDAPAIPESYIYLLALQCLVSLSEGFASFTLPIYTTIVMQKPRSAGDAVIRAPPALDFSSLPPDDASTKQLNNVRGMVESGWPALLVSLSFLIASNLSEELFVDVLSGIQNLTNVAGILGLLTPRDAFLTCVAKFAVPSRVVSSLDSSIEPATPRSAGVLSAESLGLSALTGTSAQPPGLSERNLACLKALISIALFLAGSLGPTWFDVLETLQNAEYVLVLRASRGAPVHNRKNSLAPTPMSPSKGRSASGPQPPSNQIPQQNRHPLLSDLDIDSIQAAINRLFDTSKSLDDQAFKHFIASLCKLSAAMVGMQYIEEEGPEGRPSEDAISPSVSSPLSPTKSDQRRRASGIHLSRTMRTGDYGVSKLGTISILNVHRLIYREPGIAWDPIVSHLLYVIRNPHAPGSIRIQAAQVLNGLLVIVPRNLTNTGELQGQVQTRVLLALSQQVAVDPIGGNYSAIVDIKKMGLETLHKILQFSGHTLVTGWDIIFDMLASVCAPTSEVVSASASPSKDTLSLASPRTRPTPLQMLSSKSNEILVRIAFQSLTLLCDSLDSLSPENLQLCISTLGQFGRQNETSIALTAAESLLWGVSDSIQSKRKDVEKEPVYTSLWMTLLIELLGLCTDRRAEVRNGSIQTLFRTLQLYGATLSLATWDECVWKIIFPLLDAISAALPFADQTSLESNGQTFSSPKLSPSPGKAWGETKILAFQSIGSIFNDFLASKVLLLESFSRAWDTFLDHVTKSTLNDESLVSTAALRCLEKALQASGKADNSVLDNTSLTWERAWGSSDEIGMVIVRRVSPVPLLSRTGSPAPFSQDFLVAFVDVLRTTYELSGFKWELERLRRLLTILKGVLTYPNSPEYRPDVDSVTPVQANVMTAINSLDLALPGSPSLVLCDLSEYVTLAFVAAFDVEDTSPSNSRVDVQKPPKRVTYIALCKKTMPRLVRQYIEFKDQVDIYNDGTVERVLSAFSIPIKLKYDCPAPSKFGSDPPLWKTATVNFLQILKHCAESLRRLSQDMPEERIEGIWRQALDVFRGGLLADCFAAEHMSLELQEAEEKFDLSLLSTLEIDVIPQLGDSRVSDDLIVQLGKTLQAASRLHVVDDRSTPIPPSSPPASQPNQKETHFSRHSAAFEVEHIFGTTAPTLLLPRERFSYWCFDLLFLICSSLARDQESSRRRVAALCIPSLMTRCHRVLASYLADEALRPNIPFPRAREEEVLYVLRKLLALQLWPGSFWAAFSSDPSKYCADLPSIDASLPPSRLIADAIKRSPKAHLFHFYSILNDLASASQRTPSAWVVPTDESSPASNRSSVDAAYTHEPLDAMHFPVGWVGADYSADAPIEVNARQLARECLKEIGKEMGAEI